MIGAATRLGLRSRVESRLQPGERKPYLAAGAEAGGMAPPDVPEGEVDGVVIGAGVAPGVSGFGPQAPKASRAEKPSESVTTDLSGASDIKIPFERVTARKEI